MSGLSNSAKLLRAFIEATGIVCTKALSAKLGIPIRSIQRMKMECATDGAEQCDAASAIDATDATGGAATDAIGAARGVSGATGGASRTHARKESPSGIVINISSSQLAAREPASEIEGLNGSTPRLIGQLAGWLAGPLNAPDPEAARAILVGSVEAYGAEKVRAGMLELETLIASGEKPRNLPKTFCAYVKAAKLPDPNAPAKQPNSNRPAWALEKDAKRAAFMAALNKVPA